uniref:Uncharacterized protein n=1 Tax=Pseudo-nitzschia australis TaxID=44445 RepID=A0A7S4EQY7_9STRA|mmetsp:Transcript_26480/g.58006  ORF Transcript_26480/g.58006 Transcript_26480/m.58006 type:complete len:223 (+) Transcript_26480:314-982(+)|eukprot:CAMPEP_0168187390 /NCGR_PEP_ID=MMETSP0139_2-20121125/15002_1 /TAXON_ID=44445 /ORGANISM="Pseudo-nitzschia australis, Strain 10249 10 AB" /LENGTH=222 /DNA_ID=CAMNT_0008109585 /DNA_START=276 /DNA_END=944 /DNA_ORIENTATION=+
MGIFNDIASVDAFAINAYCIVSALFFSACAYAQLNDPNPVQWFCAYVFGGCIPNLYWMTIGSNESSSSSKNKSTATQRLILALHGFVVLVVLAIVYKIVSVAPKLMEEVEEHHHGFLWAFMEHEEGRDSCGLLLLILHTSYLNSVLKKGPSQRRKIESSSSNGHTQGGAPASILLSPAFLSLGLFGILGVCVYVWVVHHPELVAKHALKHCQGEMFGRVGEL